MIRPFGDEHAGQLLSLMASVLDWGTDERWARFFSWKHHDNPFGPSPAWVALDGERIAGFRTFLRWEFHQGEGSVTAVRAVDTLTHPDYQGRGIFTRLTLKALDALGGEGVGFVFNTPNDRSLPGYLKMGWQVVGRLPTAMRPLSLRSLPRVAAARSPSSLWSEPSEGGDTASEILGDPSTAAGVAALLASQPRTAALRTKLSPEFLAWRYGSSPFHYRVVMFGDRPEAGLAVFRLRRRGPASEAVLAEVLVPGDDHRARRALAREVARRSGADYVLRIGGPVVGRDGFLRVLGQGPVLTWRGVREAVMPPLAHWRLTLGDVELF